jgi:hypothetical protein
MMLYALMQNMPHFSNPEIAVLGILIALLNLRSLSLTAKTRFSNQLRDNLWLGIIPMLIISILIMINHFVAAVTKN